MHILIFGASGYVGTGLADHLHGRHRLTGIVRRHPAGETAYAPVLAPDWVDDPDSVIDALAAGDAPPVDAVVAAIGGWFVDDPVLKRGLKAFDEDYDHYLRGHFTACTISARLAEERRATSTLCHLAFNGAASVEALAGSGAISVFGAAQNMLIRVADAETPSVDFRELRIMAPVGGDDRNDLSGGVQTVTLAEAARGAESVLADGARAEPVTEIRPEG